LGVSQDEAGAGIAAALPALVGALAGNTSTPRGEQALAGALGRDHDGSLLESLGGMLAGSLGGRATNGAGILGHILGDDSNQDNVVNSLAGRSGVSSSLIKRLLPILAPMVLSYLGKQLLSGHGSPAASGQGQSNAQSSGGGLGGLLGGLLGQMAGGAGEGAGGLGSILGGLLGGAQGQQRQQSSGPDLGSILGSIFGK
jgi:hypothetical protein